MDAIGREARRSSWLTMNHRSRIILLWLVSVTALTETISEQIAGAREPFA